MPLRFTTNQHNSAGSVVYPSADIASGATTPTTPIRPASETAAADPDDVSSMWGSHETPTEPSVSAMTVAGWGRDSHGAGGERRGGRSVATREAASGVRVFSGGSGGESERRSGGPGDTDLAHMYSKNSAAATADISVPPVGVTPSTAGGRLKGVREVENEEEDEDGVDSVPLKHGFSGKQLTLGSGCLLPVSAVASDHHHHPTAAAVGPSLPSPDRVQPQAKVGEYGNGQTKDAEDHVS